MRYESKTKTKACPPNGGAASTKANSMAAGQHNAGITKSAKNRCQWELVHKEAADRGTRSARSPNIAPR